MTDAVTGAEPAVRKAPPRKAARPAGARAPVRAQAPDRKPGVRDIAAAATREAILKAAIEVFARHGFSGGRVEAISKAAKSYDRMIYYYFDSKEGLYIAVLEEIYRRMNVAESKLALKPDQPVASLTEVIRFVWRYYQKNPEFITLLNTENLQRGKHIGKSQRASEYSPPAIAVIGEVLASGIAQGVFRPEVSARDVYLMITSMGYFPLSNRYTLQAFLGEKLDRPDAVAHWENFLIEAVMRTVSVAYVAPVADGSPPTVKAIAKRASRSTTTT